jgi:hypothetical protein
MARSGWARIASRLIDEILAALDRGHGAGVPSAMDALMVLPAEVLVDCRASQGSERRIERRIQRLQDGLALDPVDTKGPLPTVPLTLPPTAQRRVRANSQRR